MKTIESKIAPNPKEAQIWIDLSADPHGTVRKTWNGTKWVNNEKESINKTDIINIISPELDSLKTEINQLKNKINSSLISILNDLIKRVNKLEKHIVTE